MLVEHVIRQCSRYVLDFHDAYIKRCGTSIRVVSSKFCAEIPAMCQKRVILNKVVTRRSNQLENQQKLHPVSESKTMSAASKQQSINENRIKLAKQNAKMFANQAGWGLVLGSWQT